MPFRGNVDSSSSLLTHLLPPTEELHPPIEPEMVKRERERARERERETVIFPLFMTLYRWKVL